MARIAHTLATPLPQLLAMDWDEALLWWPHARSIHDELRSSR
ncbi:MAG: hypothetical protein R3D70_10560 [Rhizobiaceae bacterium]